MRGKLIFLHLFRYPAVRNTITNYIKRDLMVSAVLLCEKSKALVRADSFENIANKTKDTYLDMVHIFENRDIHRRGHVEFIYSALKYMESFGVHNDLEVYKSLIDVLPKGKFIPQNIIQAEFMHYPKQQQCCIDLLQQMEDNGVMPDLEMEDMLLNVFGRKGYPLRKYWRMMYWMPKFKNLSPWPLPSTVPNDSLELAKLAVTRMSSIDLQTKLTIYQSEDIKDSIDKTWIVSAQSHAQQQLLEKHDLNKPIFIEGAFKIWIRNVCVNYFILRTETKILPPSQPKDYDDVSHLEVSIFNMSQPAIVDDAELTIHEQEDGTILAICATGTSSRDSLLSWVRHLENSGNPVLSKAVIVFNPGASPNDDETDKPALNSSTTNEKICDT